MSNSVVFNITYTPFNPSKKWNKDELAQFEHDRKFYNLTAGYNYLSYSLNSNKTKVYHNYLEYMQKNSGAFDLNKILSENDIKDLREDIAKSKSIIWHGFVSFNQEESLKFLDQKSCIDFMKKTMHALFQRSHINKDNVNFICALHTDAAHHHHIHFEFYEKKPTKLKDGKLTYSDKGKFSQRAINDFMLAASMYLKNDKDNLYVLRDKAIKKIKEDASYPDSIYKEEGIQKMMFELYKRIPVDGRIQYNASSMKDLRKDVNDIVKMIANQDPELKRTILNVYNEIEQRRKEAEEIAKENKMKDDSTVNRYIENLTYDFEARLGNVVLNEIKRMKKQENTKKEIQKQERGKNLRKQSKELRNLIKHGTSLFIKNVSDGMHKVTTDFTAKLHQVEREIEQIQYEDSLRKGEVDE